MAGILAVWNDCAPEGLAHFERWYNREHLQERVAVPGFRRGRRYEAVAGIGARASLLSTPANASSLNALPTLAGGDGAAARAPLRSLVAVSGDGL